MKTNSNYLTGSFRDRTSAERAYNRLRERGYTDDEINIIMSDETRRKYFETDKDRVSDYEQDDDRRSVLDRDNDRRNVLDRDDDRRSVLDRDDDNVGGSEFGNKVMEGVGTGSAIGGAVGATAGIIAAIGTSLVIPGLGLVIAGPIAAGLAGAGAGGLTGGLVGALVGAGIPKDRAEKHESDLKEGDIVMGVRPRSDEDADYLERDWREYEGHHNIYR